MGCMHLKLLHTVVWEKFTVEYFHVKIVRVKIFSSSRVADEFFLTTNIIILRLKLLLVIDSLNYVVYSLY